MRIRLLVALAGHDQSWSPGEEADFAEADAGRLMAAGYAERVEAVETAAVEVAERAVLPAPAPRQPRKVNKHERVRHGGPVSQRGR